MRTALGVLLIQKQLGFSDRELVEEITENPYLQYFIWLPGYQAVPPFVPSFLVECRKRLTVDVLCEINEMIIGIIHQTIRHRVMEIQQKRMPKVGIPGR